MDREGDHKSGAKPAPSTDSLSASSESETFESWTVVSEGNNINLKSTLDVPEEASAEETEDPEKHLDEERERSSIEIIDNEESNKRGTDSTDDLSDGISIISDSESAGRISPHPFVRQIPETVLNESEDAAYDPLTPPTTPLREAELCTKVIHFVERSRERLESNEEPQQKEGPRKLFGIGVRGLFVLSLIVAILAFIGRMNFWGTELGPTDVTSLLQKLKVLELQNNILRAEIDILNKQINHMKTKQPEGVNERVGKVSYKNFENYERKPEKPKWAGEGDMYIEPLEPYKKPPPPPYNAEKQGKPRESIPPNPQGQQPHYDRKGEYYDRKLGREDYQKYPDSHNYPAKGGKHDPKYEQKYDTKYQKRDTGKPYKNEDYKKGKGDYYPKDKYYKDDYEKYRKSDGRKDHFSGDGHYDYKNREDDWHEKMMQQREEMRRKQEKHNSNNWYIERGNGREEARVDSREYRREER